MSTTLTSIEVIIPKQIREALNLSPGCAFEFAVSREGEVILHKADAKPAKQPDRFERARGKADIKW